MKRSTRVVLASGVVLAVLLLAFLVWPTPYSYRSYETRWGKMIRINRITQGVSVLDKGQWKSLHKLEQDAVCVLGPTELAKVKFEPLSVRKAPNDRLAYNVFNGTARTLGDLRISFIAKPRNSALEVREYEAYDHPYVRPGTWGRGDAYILGLPDDMANMEWSARLKAATWNQEER